MTYVSQFPLWDFFECNNITINATSNAKNGDALNSLCGISSNATGQNMQELLTTVLHSSTLNSLCGISSNATITISTAIWWISLGFCSQFPLWDFFECNKKEWDELAEALSGLALSIPFVGFLRMQQGKISFAEFGVEIDSSQFPLWDFFECNPEKELGRWGLCGNSQSLNSLCGISSNATRQMDDLLGRQLSFFSQFPLWDFFECNPHRCSSGRVHAPLGLSIPFVGFLRMQQILCGLGALS